MTTRILTAFDLVPAILEPLQKMGLPKEVISFHIDAPSVHKPVEFVATSYMTEGDGALKVLGERFVELAKTYVLVEKDSLPPERDLVREAIDMRILTTRDSIMPPELASVVEIALQDLREQLFGARLP